MINAHGGAAASPDDPDAECRLIHELHIIHRVIIVRLRVFNGHGYLKPGTVGVTELKW